MNLLPMPKKKNIMIFIKIFLLNLRKILHIVSIRILYMFRSEITDLIEDEIIGRYFYEEGAIAWTIKKDEQIIKALEILNNKEEYSSILKENQVQYLLHGKAEDPDIASNR